MNRLPQVSKRNRLAFLLAVGLLVFLIAGGLLWQTHHQSESFDTFYDVKDVEGFRWDPTKYTDLSDANYDQLNEESNGFLNKMNDYDAAKLSPEDKLTYDILKWNLSAEQQV